MTLAEAREGYEKANESGDGPTWDELSDETRADILTEAVKAERAREIKKGTRNAAGRKVA